MLSDDDDDDYEYSPSTSSSSSDRRYSVHMCIETKFKRNLWDLKGS